MIRWEENTVCEEGDMADVILLQLRECTSPRDQQMGENLADVIMFAKPRQIPGHYRLQQKNIPPADRNKKCSNPKCFEKACLLFEWEIKIVDDQVGGDIYQKYHGEWNVMASCHDKKCVRLAKKNARLNLISKFTRNPAAYLPLHQ